MSTPTSTATESGAPAGAPTGSLFTRLYTGTGAFGIVANRRKFYVLTVVIVAICLASIIFRGFSFGIDFTGGTKLSMPAGNHDQDRVAAVVEEAIGEDCLLYTSPSPRD